MYAYMCATRSIWQSQHVIAFSALDSLCTITRAHKSLCTGKLLFTEGEKWNQITLSTGWILMIASSAPRSAHCCPTYTCASNDFVLHVLWKKKVSYAQWSKYKTWLPSAATIRSLRPLEETQPFALGLSTAVWRKLDLNVTMTMSKTSNLNRVALSSTGVSDHTVRSLLQER